MAEVDIVVAGRTYRLACEDGQEGHLSALAADLDAEARRVAAQTGVVEEGRLLLMVGLMVADRLQEAQAAAQSALSAPDGAAIEASMGRLEAALLRGAQP